VSKLRKQFGKKLRALRLSEDWTQEEVAERLGLSLNFLSLIERGLKAPSFDNIELIAKVFRISVAELFTAPSRVQEGERVQRRTHGVKPST
jgi:transcriptional regulator with XRE-family HTH domain